MRNTPPSRLACVLFLGVLALAVNTATISCAEDPEETDSGEKKVRSAPVTCHWLRVP